MSDFSIEDVQALVDLVHQAVGMMEPYYSQCGADDEILKSLEPFEARLPYTVTLKPWHRGCPECGKHFDSATSTAQHLHSKHPQQWSRKRADAEMRERNKTFATKAEYLAQEA